MKDTYDLILICQSDVVDYSAYAKLPLERRDLYETLVYPRMVHYKGQFRGHLDIINHLRDGVFYEDSDYPRRRQLLNIWNLPAMTGPYLANYMMQNGFKVAIINNIDSELDRFKKIYASARVKPLVGISSTFYLTIKQVARIAKMLRAVDPAMEIVLGGAFANAQTIGGAPDAFEAPMRKYGMKYVLHAFNSEIDLRDLLAARRNGTAIDAVNNLCYLDSGDKFHVTKIHWNEPVLNELEAHWDKLNLPFLNNTIQIRSAAGCPFSCAFCSYPTTARSWKTVKPDAVREHLDAVTSIPNLKQVIFIDDTFNVPKNRFKDLLRIFCDYDFEWFSFLRVQFVDEEIVQLMKDSGCKGVYLGVESASDKVLKNMNKRATSAEFYRGVGLLAKYGITSMSALVLGFPGETEETIRESVNFIENSGTDFYSLKEFFYIKHTKVYDDREQYGLTGMGNRWSHDTMTSEDASRIKIELFKEIRNSIHIDPDTSLWYWAYLCDQGFTIPEVKEIQKHINRITLDQIDGRFDDAHPAYLEIRDILNRQSRAA